MARSPDGSITRWSDGSIVGWSGRSMFSCLAEPEKSDHFLLGKTPVMTDRQSFVLEKADGNPAQFQHRVSNRLKHSPDLLVPTLGKGHLIPAIIAFTDGMNLGLGEPGSVGETDTRPQALQARLLQHAFDLHLISLGYLFAGPAHDAR